MSFNSLFRASLYLTLFLATTLLNIDSTGDTPYAMVYIVAVAATSVLAFLTVDRDPRRGIPRELANFVALLAAIVGLLEGYNNPDILLLAVGHTLVYFQIIYYFMQKTVEVDWVLLLIGLVEAVIGVFISQSDTVGILVFCWSLSSLWTFALFFLRRESLRTGPPAGVTVFPTADSTNPYPGLLNLAFVFSLLRIAATTLLLGIGMFLLMPRWSVQGVNRFGNTPSAKHLTGFGTDIQLGKMGEILETDEIVMSVEFSDEKDTVVAPDPEILLRGLTLTRYQNSRWSRGEDSIVSLEKFNSDTPSIQSGTTFLRQRFKMEETGSDVLFAVRPFLRINTSSQSEIVFSRSDGTIYRRDMRPDYIERRTSRPNKFDYTVISSTDPKRPQPYEFTRSLSQSDDLLRITPTLAEPLKVIAETAIVKILNKPNGTRLEEAHAIERYLRDGEFTYSLHMQVIDNQIDPVLDFLKNRKEGHCEYFASALTLLCRARGIPARMVNGFKGGDWNDLAQVLIVRQKYAHSWVEVLVSLPGQRARWETLDPTPSRERAESIAQVSKAGPRFRYWSDFIRSTWTFYVASFDSERQERTIYGPIRELALQAVRGFRLLGQMLRDATKWFYFENVNQLFSIRGFVVSFAAMLVVVSLLRLARWLLRRILGSGSNATASAAASDPGLAFYMRLVRLLSKFGIERSAAETPREFARRAATILETRTNFAPFALLPATIVDVFYAKRFGHRDPAFETLQEMDSSLDLFEAAFQSSTSP